MPSGSATVWSIHAGITGEKEGLFLAKGYIAIGWAEMGYLGDLPNDQEAAKARLASTYPDKAIKTAEQDAGQLLRFVHEMAVGDLVVYRSSILVGGDRLVYLGRVAGHYLFNPTLDPEYPNVRRVEWLRSLPSALFSKEALQQQASWMSISRIGSHAPEFLAAAAGRL